MEDDVIDVLYIVGAGRSGSTLLEKLLAGRSGFVGVGELFFLLRRGHVLNELCGCGQPFDRCPFWREVMADSFPDEHLIEWFVGQQKYFCSARRLLQLRFRFLRTAGFQRRLDRFHDKQSRLFRAICATSGSQVVVDSSKFVSYGYLLASNPNLRVHAIHLVRDPRAVAFSWLRTKTRPESQGVNAEMLRLPVAASTRIWVLHNILAGGLRRHLDHSCLLRYEDYCVDDSQVDEALVRLGLADVGPTDRTIAAADAAGGQPRVVHSVSGNPVRLSSGAVRVVRDDEWRRALGTRDKLVITAIAAPAMARYGYLPSRRERLAAGAVPCR